MHIGVDTLVMIHSLFTATEATMHGMGWIIFTAIVIAAWVGLRDRDKRKAQEKFWFGKD